MSHYIAIVRFSDGEVHDYLISATSTPQIDVQQRLLRKNLSDDGLVVRCIVKEEEFATLF